MAEREIVAFDPVGELEAPQGSDTYVAKKAVKLEQPLTTDSTLDGRDVAVDGTKLDLIAITQTVDLDALELKVDGLSSVVVLKGSWDASTAAFPTSTLAGETWICSVAGSVGGESFGINDRITALVDGASTTVYTGQWLKQTYTDSVLSVASKTGAVTLEEADITDLQAYLTATSIGTLAELNAIVVDATLGDSVDFATAAQGVLAASALQQTGWKRNQASLIGSPAGSGAPALAAFGPSGVCKAMSFAVGDSVYVSGIVPHDALGGGTIFPVICWTTNGTSVNSVKWQISYTFANGYSTTVFPANSVINLEEAAAGIAWQHMTTLAASGIGSAEIGGGYIAEYKRISNGGTDNADTVFGLFGGFHYPTNKFDTLNKEPPFFV